MGDEGMSRDQSRETRSPVWISLAALAMTEGVRRFSVPSWSVALEVWWVRWGMHYWSGEARRRVLVIDCISEGFVHGSILEK